MKKFGDLEPGLIAEMHAFAEEINPHRSAEVIYCAKLTGRLLLQNLREGDQLTVIASSPFEPTFKSRVIIANMENLTSSSLRVISDTSSEDCLEERLINFGSRFLNVTDEQYNMYTEPNTIRLGTGVVIAPAGSDFAGSDVQCPVSEYAHVFLNGEQL